MYALTTEYDTKKLLKSLATIKCIMKEDLVGVFQASEIDKTACKAEISPTFLIFRRKFTL